MMEFPRQQIKNGLALFAEPNHAETPIHNETSDHCRHHFILTFSRKTKYKVKPVLKINEEIIPQVKVRSSLEYNMMKD
jgi:hypothetical protein